MFRRITAPIAAMTTGTVLTLSGCGPSEGLRIESETPQTQSGSTDAANTEVQIDSTFSSEEIRQAFLDDEKIDGLVGYDAVYEVLTLCGDCVHPTGALMTNDKLFELAEVTTPRETTGFAGLIIENQNGTPKVSLIITGTNITLSPGTNGTVVAQEAVESTGDQTDSPTGWTVRVFRYRDGVFVSGQRVSELR